MSNTCVSAWRDLEKIHVEVLAINRLLMTLWAYENILFIVEVKIFFFINDYIVGPPPEGGMGARVQAR
jgi:hypothetical protein